MIYIVVDATLNCTGIRDGANGGFLDPSDALSPGLLIRLANWLAEYETEHYRGFKNESRIQKLDQEGKEIAIAIRQEIPDTKIAYYSDASGIEEELMTEASDGSLFWLKVN